MVRFELYSTGSNSHGQLGIGTDDDLSEYTPIALPRCEPLELACGANHTLLLVADGDSTELYGAGSNATGQLGNGESRLRTTFDRIGWNEFVPADAPIDERAYEIVGVDSTWSTSFVHLRARESESLRGSVAKSDILVSFGSNDWGERASDQRPREGTVSTSSSFVSFDHVMSRPVRINRLVAGPRHVLALLEPLEPLESASSSPILVGWGASRHGQLGQHAPGGEKAPKITPRPEIVHLPAGFSARDVVDFSCGKDHSAILLQPHASTSRSEPTLVVLGSNKHGQLGPGGTKLEPKQNVLPLSDLVTACQHSQRTEPLVRVRTTWNSTFVAVDPRGCCGSNPFVGSFGSNSHGQLGDAADAPSADVRFVVVNATPCRQSRSDALTVQFPDEAVTLESDRFGSFETTSARQIGSIELSTGSEHALALIKASSTTTTTPNQQDLYTWGWNEHGNLGLGFGDVEDRREPVRVRGPIGARIEAGWHVERIWGGMATSWVLLSCSQVNSTATGTSRVGSDDGKWEERQDLVRDRRGIAPLSAPKGSRTNT
ncbi:hypothetical protein JCM3766R1_001920 [Sporobolomyces carnicolor]